MLMKKPNSFDMLFNKPGLNDKVNFFRLMSVSQWAWLGVRDAILAIRESEKNPVMQFILDDLVDSISKGDSLAEGMANHTYLFDPDEIALVRSAEITGNMVETLTSIYIEKENFHKINKKIKKAMTYPTILLVMSLIAVVVLLVYAIPSIISIFPNKDQLPSITKFVLSLSDWFQKYWFVAFSSITWIIVVWNFLYSKVDWFRKFIDQLLIKIPVAWNVIRNFYMYRFSKLMYQFYFSWLSPVVSLKLLKNIFSNFVYKRKIIQIRNDIMSWFSMYDSMQWSSLFDPILVQIVHVGEETGTIWEVLWKVSGFYEDELNDQIDVLMTLMEPLLIVFVAGIIWVLIAAIFLPMSSVLWTI